MEIETGKTYLILGAGRQGTAAAYNLAHHGNAAKIILADSDLHTAEQSSKRVNHLTRTPITTGIRLDVTDLEYVKAVMADVDGVLSAVPYYFNYSLTQAAIDARVHFCDMGGNTDIARKQLTLDSLAKNAGISIVPDCGMGPGLISSMAVFVMNYYDEPQEIFIYDAGLPQEPTPPWNYEASFHINGLTNEMDGEAYFIRNGKVTAIPTLTEPEMVVFEPLGKLEADVTSGGLSTSAWTFEGKLHTLENKVLRYPGHYEWLRAFKALGLFQEEPIPVGGQMVSPRELYHSLLEPQIKNDDIRDICLIRVVGHGKKNDEIQTVHYELIDYYDEETGFTAMERLTGWHCSVMLHLQVHGQVKPGANPVELAVDAGIFMDEFARRGFDIRFQVQ